MKKANEETLVSTVLPVEKVSACAPKVKPKVTVETALRLMWRASGGKHDTAITHLRSFMFFLI
jgi:hypothetical protein